MKCNGMYLRPPWTNLGCNHKTPLKDIAHIKSVIACVCARVVHFDFRGLERRSPLHVSMQVPNGNVCFLFCHRWKPLVPVSILYLSVGWTIP